MRTAILDSTLDFNGIQATVNNIPGSNKKRLGLTGSPKINDKLRKPSRDTPSYMRPEYQPHDTFMSIPGDFTVEYPHSNPDSSGMQYI